MPLPPALAAKLKKRGIIKEKEEVIAENYDSGDKEKDKDAEEELASGAPGCPNKYNPYHLCSQYCLDHWQDGLPEKRLSESYNRRRERMLKKYPLPDGWKEVYDAGIGRHYYWFKQTDEVSWLSPRHPHAIIGEAAPKMARELCRDRDVPQPSHQPSFMPPPTSRNDDRRRGRDDDGGDRRDKKRRRDDRERDDTPSDDDVPEDKRKEPSERDRLQRAKRKGIDPMDPAAYSDVKQGKWASGLFEDDKSGVDTTAGGPLFQMRPYPAPGAILKKKQQKKDD